MGKDPSFRKIQARWAQISSRLKKNWGILIKNARPFLAPKYWLIYLCCFGIGFYLWGPYHGWEKINIRPAEKKKQRQAKQVSIETLQRELASLKQKLQAAQSKSQTPAFDPGSFSRPAPGRVILGSEWEYTDKSWRFHTGVDIALEPGSNIIAAAAGVVTTVKGNSGGGFSVTIDHGSGWESLYQNLAGVLVHPGQKVIKGVIIGTGGQIQSMAVNDAQRRQVHLHFEIHHNQKPVDPCQIIPGLR